MSNYMKLEDQCCSLELAKKLKELGVRQESLFWWHPEELGWTGPFYNDTLSKHPYDGFSTFTVAELGEMLPLNVMPASHKKMTRGNGYWLECHKENGQWNVCYRTGRHVELCFKKADTEADARAKMLCYLLENKLI